MPHIYFGDELINVSWHAVQRATERLWPDLSDTVILYLIERMLTVGYVTEQPPSGITRSPDSTFIECGEVALVLVGNEQEIVIKTVLTYGPMGEHPGADLTRGARLLSRLTAKVAA